MKFRSQDKVVLRLLVAAGVVLGGCSQSDEPQVGLGVVENPTPPTEADSVPIDSLPTAAQEPSQAETEPHDSEPSVTATYEPPFPDRVDLFVAPKRKSSGRTGSPEGVEKTVELLGFVNVDRQRVVLSIDGAVAQLAEGGKWGEIEVISIQPPAVVLQRGRQRWQATFEN